MARLKDFKYSTEGAYFITICSNLRSEFFGRIEQENMILSEAGIMLRKWWEKIPQKFPPIRTDYFCVMPNHLHGIILIVAADPCVGRSKRDTHMGVSLRQGEITDKQINISISKVIQWFKTMTTNEYIHGVKEKGWPSFSARLWQKGFYDRVIRNEVELLKIREYIINNPLKWYLDRENRESERYRIDLKKYIDGIIG